MNLSNKEFEVPYHVDYDRGYGIESTSNSLLLTFDNEGNLESASYSGIHFINEDEIYWADEDMTTEEAIEILIENNLIQRDSK